MRLLAMITSALLLTACGGGGGGGSSSGGSTGPVASTLSFPFKAIDDAERVSNQYSTGTVSGSTVAAPVVTFTGTYTTNYVYSPSNVFSYTPIGTSTVTNVNASAGTTTTAVILSNFSNGAGTQAINSTSANYYNNLGTLLGSKSNSITDFVTSGGQVPVSGQVGDQGQLYSADISYTSYSFSYKCGTEVSTYVVQPDTANTVIVKSVLTRSITNSSCGASSVTTGYTRYTQTSSKALYVDFSDATLTFRVTIN